MRITSKGQVTIPKEIREAAGLLPHTEVDFRLAGGEVVVSKRPGERLRGKKMIEWLRGKATLRMTTDEIMALTRGED